MTDSMSCGFQWVNIVEPTDEPHQGEETLVPMGTRLEPTRKHYAQDP